MEFSNLGAHCYLCNQQDFLPLKCDKCGNNFCKNHINEHSCIKQNIVSNEEIIVIKKRRYKCKFCQKKLNKYLLIRCKYCNFRFCARHINHDCSLFTKNQDDSKTKLKKCIIT